MSKSLKRLLSDAAELVAMAGVNNADSVDVSVWYESIQIHLKVMSLARVFRAFGLTRSRLHTKIGKEGDLHVSFVYRGATWRCVVLVPQIAEWQALTADPAKRITGPTTGRCLRQPATTKALAAPAAKLRRLSAPPAPPAAATAVAEKPPTPPGQRSLFAQ